mgnify:FL=1
MFSKTISKNKQFLEKFKTIQVSWVKEGFDFAQTLLKCGVNDLGGTLINESISTSAGSKYGQLASPALLRKLARNVGKVPAERYTTYKLRTIFDAPKKDLAHPLDRLSDSSKNNWALTLK